MKISRSVQRHPQSRIPFESIRTSLLHVKFTCQLDRSRRPFFAPSSNHPLKTNVPRTWPHLDPAEYPLWLHQLTQSCSNSIASTYLHPISATNSIRESTKYSMCRHMKDVQKTWKGRTWYGLLITRTRYIITIPFLTLRSSQCGLSIPNLPDYASWKCIHELRSVSSTHVILPT